MTRIVENPLTKEFQKHAKKALYTIDIIVPFLSEFVQKALSTLKATDNVDKRIITRLDDSSSTTFNMVAMSYLIKAGFQIRFDNRIHMKVYTFDDTSFVTSANLTDSGFEKNYELTAIVDGDNNLKCKQVFQSLWDSSAHNIVTQKFIDDNMAKYIYIKTQENATKTRHSLPKPAIVNDDVESILDVFIKVVSNDHHRNIWIESAYIDRISFLKRLENRGFNVAEFYARRDSENRRDTIMHKFTWGLDSKLASIGMWERQYRQAMQSETFKDFIMFLYPKLIGQEGWDLENINERKEFCLALFNFKIPQFVETFPMRFASYFYPDHFLPVSRIIDLTLACKVLGYTDIEDNWSIGEKFYECNTRLFSHPNFKGLKGYQISHILYCMIFAKKILESRNEGHDIEFVKQQYSTIWEKKAVTNCYSVLLNYRLL